MAFTRLASMERISQQVREFYGEDSRIPAMFDKCTRDTLETTIQILDKDGRRKWPVQDETGTIVHTDPPQITVEDSVYVITGDIPAMWLRDSSCQLHMFLRFAAQEPELQDLILGLIRNQMRCILLDPYANAFNEEANGAHWAEDRMEVPQDPALWERKYEIDSLCYPVQLSYLFWKATGRTDQFDENWIESVQKIIETFRTEQYHESRSPYRFERPDCIYCDTLSRGGRGALVKEGIGLIFSGFRPSDDACTYGYLIPSNMFAAVILEYISEIAETIYHNGAMASEAAAFAREVRTAIEELAYTVYTHIPQVVTREQVAQEAQEPQAAPVYAYAYEMDGYGQYLFMDDSNVPSLLAMPYIGYCRKDDPRYLATRRMVLSQANPYYYEGATLRGIGSPHTPPDYVWDISLAIQGLTTDDLAQKRQILEMMVANDAGTGLMHEGINVRNCEEYTRPWFSWANSMFCELVMDYMDASTSA